MGLILRDVFMGQVECSGENVFIFFYLFFFVEFQDGILLETKINKDENKSF